MKMRFTLASLFVLASIVPACGSSSKGDDAPQSDGVNPPSTTTKATSHVAVNDRASWTTPAQRDAVVVSAAQLSFPAKGNEALLQKAPGDILVSDRQSGSGAQNPYGFMRKVVSVAQQGDSIVVETEQAYLDEVLVGTFEINADPTDLQPFTLDGAGAGTQGFDGLGGPGYGVQGQFDVTKGLDLGFDKSDITFFNVKAGAFEVPVKGTKVSATLGGSLKMSQASFHFKPSINLGGDISVPGGFFEKFNPKNYVNEFHVKLKGDVSAKLVMAAQAQLQLAATADQKLLEDIAAKVTAELQKNAPQEIEIPLVDIPFVGPPLPTPLGPIPITYDFAIKLACTASVTGSAQAEAGFEATSSAEFGAQYTKDGGWKEIKNLDFQFNPIGPNVSFGAAAEVKCQIQPKLTTKLAGIAGPEVFVGGYLSAKGSYSETCPQPPKDGKPEASAKLALSAGVNAGVGAKIEVFKVKIAEAQIPLFDKNVTLADKEWKFGSDKSLGWCSADMMGSGGMAGAGGMSGTGGMSGAGGSSGSSQGGAAGQGGSGSGGSGPVACGNGKIDGLEQCDGTDFGQSTCISATGNPNAQGQLKCTALCTLDTSGCAANAACDHDVCIDGTALKKDCTACTQKVCANNDYCCTVEWDLTCVQSAKDLCGSCP